MILPWVLLINRCSSLCSLLGEHNYSAKWNLITLRRSVAAIPLVAGSPKFICRYIDIDLILKRFYLLFRQRIVLYLRWLLNSLNRNSAHGTHDEWHVWRLTYAAPSVWYPNQHSTNDFCLLISGPCESGIESFPSNAELATNGAHFGPMSLRFV